MIEQLQTPEVLQFLKEHQHDDPVMLMLQAKKYPHLPIREIVSQIQSRQKASHKLPEWYEQEDIIFPPSLSMEQCSSETTAKFKASLFLGESMVDLTGGAGVDTYYFSRSFKNIHYVEKEAMLCEIASHNFKALSANIKVNHFSATQYLSHLPGKVDLIYIDPGRRDSASNKVFMLEDCEPDLTELQNSLLEKAKDVLVKTSPMLDIQLAEGVFKNVKAIYVVAVNNEVKEVLYHLQKNNFREPLIHAVDARLRTEENYLFTFTKSEEANATVKYGMPQKYIYEPNKAILKAGAFKSLGNQLGLLKFHLHSHLYTSEKLIPFPGRVFRCLEVLPYQKKAVLAHLPRKQANITNRNFPDTVQQVRKKLNLKDGGDDYLFATTNMEGKPVILRAQKI